MNDLQTLPQTEAVRTRENCRGRNARGRDRTIDTAWLGDLRHDRRESGAPVLAEPYLFWSCTGRSRAFVCVVGMMVAYGTRRRPRCGIMRSASGGDQAAVGHARSNNYPLLSMDVQPARNLATAGLSQPRDSIRLRILIVAGILLGT